MNDNYHPAWGAMPYRERKRWSSNPRTPKTQHMPSSQPSDEFDWDRAISGLRNLLEEVYGR